MRIHRRNQQGVVLLIVVSLLVLFVLIGVTYAIVTSQYRRGARIVSRQKQLGVDPQQHLDSALYQIVRDTRSSTSVVRGHSLLRDIYGTSVHGRVSGQPNNVPNPVILENKQFLRFRAVPLPQSRVTPWNGQWNYTPNYYTGCVLTFTNGPAKGTSTRIIGFQAQKAASGMDLAFDVMLPKTNKLPAAGVEFVVNGHSFSGAGAGHNAGQRDLTNQALQPNLKGSPTRIGAYLAGGANESYDAVDYQNMALAAIIPEGGTVIPSFHRPALIRYAQAQDSWDLARQRTTILRPMPWDHPNFTGSNAAPLLRSNPVEWAYSGRWSANADSRNNAWDVDNDNDGITDSIWVDMGMPVQTDSTGRKYKPLFAVLCVDMDGKLNLNAHGNYSHVLAGGQAPPSEVSLAGGRQSRHLRPAQGFGPAEVSFRGVCANQADYAFLLTNRYGRDGRPGKPGMDALASAKLLRFTSLPQDLLGEVALGVDQYGQPVYETPFRNVGGKMVPANGLMMSTDTPYEMILSQPHHRGWSTVPTVADTPYSVTELERVLRSHDADQRALPGRLQRLHNSKHLVTTDSYDLPVANGTDLNLALIRQQITKLGIELPPELYMGLRWNINQPFGNGLDDNKNGVLDEPNEAFGENWLNTAHPFDHDNDGITGKNDPLAGYQTRQQYAQRLYSLLMAVKDPAVLWDTNGDNQATKAETAERLAQWAINAVDFRDADSIMTPFQYDPNPLDGWNVVADSPMVWGCERPELLITETLAFHDRRTENNKQRLRPRGSLFVELYNPWTGSSPQPAELYGNTGGVVLSGAPGGSPTWRMLIVKDRLRETDPDSWKLTANSTEIERSIYFTKQDPKTLPSDFPNVQPYQPKGNNLGMRSIAPGHYAVVGSAGRNLGNGSYITPIGRRTDAAEDNVGALLYDTTRHIRLNPNANGNQVQVRNNRNGVEPDPTQVQPVVAIPINSPHSLSISEPTSGYGVGDPDWDQNLAAGEGAYGSPKNQPLDTDRLPAEDGTYPHYRDIYLQRLANPLLPWNAKTNPYRTVDNMSVDLTIFNGLSARNPAVAYQYRTHERGGQRHLVAKQAKDRNLWKHEPYSSWVPPRNDDADVDKTGTHHFNMYLKHTLGSLNASYGPALQRANVPPPPFGKPASFYLGAPAPQAGIPATFPWLAWNNRPFVSPHELMLVPFSSQFRLTRDFNLSGNFNVNLYQPNNRGDFGHLLNFYDTRAGLYRAFEFLQTASHFTGTETILNAAQFSGVKPDGSSNLLHPPFNQISNFRDPGKINLNTIFDRRVWNGLWNDDLNNVVQVRDRGGNLVPRKYAMGASDWSKFVASRRGYGADNGNLAAVNNGKPSYFANPFRAVSSRDVTSLAQDPIESTIMRSEQNSALPLFSGRSQFPHNDVRVNPSARFQPLQRVSNLTTTRSNVYAIWITVGYFEVEYAGPGQPLVYPDGYRLGQELGWDRGAIHRHRAFYMVDRSIPVAFDAGKNHNVDRAILLRRFIE